MKQHPEQRDDEIYMGNATANELLCCSWRTSRLGDVAFDSAGSVIPKSSESFGYGKLLPWFIQRSEVEQTIRAEELAVKPWSAGKIRDLMPLLTEEWNPHGSTQP